MFVLPCGHTINRSDKYRLQGSSPRESEQRLDGGVTLLMMVTNLTRGIFLHQACA